MYNLYKYVLRKKDYPKIHNVYSYAQQQWAAKVEKCHTCAFCFSMTFMEIINHVHTISSDGQQRGKMPKEQEEMQC